MKTICVMQPYVFPYLPYYQMASVVDEFWILDDVQFIRQGWMNRNYILLGGQKHMITFPITRGRREEFIAEKTLPDSFQQHLCRVIATLEHAYGKASHADRVMSLLAELARKSWNSFLEFAMETLRLSFERLKFYTPLYLSSSLGLSPDLRGSNRILEICAHAEAGRYVNPAGGKTLYNPEAFQAKGIKLQFLHGNFHPYSQTGRASFLPGLSILDLIARLDYLELKTQLGNYHLTES